MQISSTQLTRPKKLKAKTDGPSTLLNEPHIPMDSVMRGFSQIKLSSNTKEALTFAAIGALGGALGAATGTGRAIPAAALITGGISAVSAAASPQHSSLGAGLAGLAYGGFGAAIGLAVSSATGINPILTTLVSGGVMGGIGALFRQNPRP